MATTTVTVTAGLLQMPHDLLETNSMTDEGLIRDEGFYMAFIVFKVENILFKVPRRAFEELSDVFRAMFTLPPGQETDVDGMTDERPLILEGIKANDFRSFLKVLYPPCILGEVIPLSEPEWASVLSLAHMWNFHRIRKLAIDELTNCNVDEIRKVELAHKYDIEEWYHSAYSALVRRERALSFDEANRLGFDFALKMGRVREDILKNMVIGGGGAHGWHRPITGRSRQKVWAHPATSIDFGGSTSGSSSNGVGGSGTPEIPVLSSADDSMIDMALAEVFGIKRTNRRQENTSGRRATQINLGNAQFSMDYVLTMPDLDSTELL